MTLLNKEFIPLVMDTCGRMGKPFLNFLKDVAGHTADRASGNVNERTQAIYDSIEPPNELRNHVHLRNLALIHVALITSLMQRIAGSVVTMGPDAEYTAHTNFTPSRTLLQTPIKLTLDHGGNS